MNGDTGKISASAVYTSSTDSSLTGLAPAAIDTQTGTTILSSNNNNNNNNNLNNNNASLAIMSQSQFGPRVANNCVQVPTTNEYSNVNGLMANAGGGGGNTSSSTASSYDGAASTQSTDLYQSDISQNVDSSASVTTPEGAVMPLEQLKQMLLSQLEYYFSRYGIVLYILYSRLLYLFKNIV